MEPSDWGSTFSFTLARTDSTTRLTNNFFFSWINYCQRVAKEDKLSELQLHVVKLADQLSQITKEQDFQVRFNWKLIFLKFFSDIEKKASERSPKFLILACSGGQLFRSSSSFASASGKQRTCAASSSKRNLFSCTSDLPVHQFYISISLI